MIQGKLRILAIATASLAPAVFAGVTFTENFMNYAERAPGVTLSDDWITVQYDPIWQRSGFIDVRPKGVASLYGQPIALAKGRFDLAFDYVYLNSTLPAEAKKDKPAVAADWDYFDVVFTDGAKEQSVRVAADAVAGARRAKPVPNHIWWKFGVVGRGQKLEIYSTASRRFEKVADVALPFVPTGFNIRVADGKVFITISGTSSAASYALNAGDTPDKTAEAEVKQGDTTGDVIIVRDAKAGGEFFSINRK